jgi:FkbM family methyltransferase
MKLKNLKIFVKSLRYNYWLSRVLLFLFYPVVKAGKASDWLKMQLKINGGRLRYDGMKLNFPDNVGVNTATKIYWKGDKGYETQVWKTMKYLVGSGTVFFDIGSNIGFYAVLVNKVNPKIVTLAFEPLPHIYKCNLRFHKANQVSTRSEVINAAVSDSVGTTKILFPAKSLLPNEVSSASMDPAFFEAKGFAKEEIEISTTTLDQTAKTYGNIEFRNAILKIDVEGHEFSVLKGGMEFVKKYRPSIIIEIFLKEDNLKNIVEWMKRFDYLIYAIASDGLIRIPEEEIFYYEGDRNFLLLPSEKIKRKMLTLIPYHQLQMNILQP